jgi:predicted exporter
MKKYYWLIVGAILGFFATMFAYVMLNFIVVDGKLNLFAVVGVIVIYAVVLYLLGLLYERIK